MKDFRLNENGMYICEECNASFTCKENVSKHVKYHNMTLNDYYTKWLKEPGDGFCKECGKSISLKHIYCSIECKRVGAGKKTSFTAKQKRIKIKKTFKFTCLECNEKFKTSLSLNKHIIKIHNIKIYYDKFLKKENEGNCKICNTTTKFSGRIKYGYNWCCSKICSDKYRYIARTQTNLKNFGVKNVFEIPEVKKKIKNSMTTHFGVDNNMKCKEGRDAYSKSINNKYGVNWPLQNREILEKGQKSAKTLKQFNEKIWYQGTYELDFLTKYCDTYPDIQRGPSINYENKIYHPDFYIPSLNLIIEIKSSWTLDKNEMKLKSDATINAGYKFIMILDKNYHEFQ